MYNNCFCSPEPHANNSILSFMLMRHAEYIIQITNHPREHALTLPNWWQHDIIHLHGDSQHGPFNKKSLPRFTFGDDYLSNRRWCHVCNLPLPIEYIAQRGTLPATCPQAVGTMDTPMEVDTPSEKGFQRRRRGVQTKESRAKLWNNRQTSHVMQR